MNIELNIEATSLPDEIRSRTVELLKHLCREYAENDTRKEEPDIAMDLWDFAGQELYYASHPVFFSSRAIYLLVHNLSKAVNDIAMPCARKGNDIVLENRDMTTNLEKLQSWLATIHILSQMKEETAIDRPQRQLNYLRPPVIIVGTHADRPSGNISGIELEIQRGIAGKDYEKHVIRPFYHIDNTGGCHQTGKLKHYFSHKFLIFHSSKILNFSCESCFF